MGPSPLVEFFKRGEVARDVRLMAAEGALAPRAHEQLGILMLLVDDPDEEVRAVATATLDRIPKESIAVFLARPDVPVGLTDFFARRGIAPSQTPPAGESDDPLVDVDPPTDEPLDDDENADRESVSQKIAKMNFPQRLKAAVKGSREMRSILIRDPNKMISAAVLSSPKLTEQEVDAFSRMANVSDDVLRIIASNRAWTKNYSVVVGLTKNPKTPLGLSLNFLARLNESDVKMLSIDRNVPEALRIAARKKMAAGKK